MANIFLAVGVLLAVAFLLYLVGSSPWLLAGFAFLGLGLASRKFFSWFAR